MKLKIFLLHLFFVFAASEVPLNEFFPYGIANGDAVLEREGDISSPPQTLQYPFPFFDVAQPTLWVNENGIISFNQKISEFTPWCKAVLPQYRMIAPFWADVDARYIGNIFYRQTTEATVLEKARLDIYEAFGTDVQLKWAFIATWEDVTYFIDLNDTNVADREKNTFQVALVTDGSESYVIFYYNEITWTTGDVSDGTNGLGGKPAEIGYDYGDGVNRETITESCTADVISVANKTNIRSPGKFIFHTNDVKPTPSPECHMNYTGEICITPNTIDYLGNVPIDITNIQLSSTEVALCRFYVFQNTTENDAEIISLTHIRCGAPFIFLTGRVKMEIEVWDTVDSSNSTLRHTYSGFIYVTQPGEPTLKFEVLPGHIIKLSWIPTSIPDWVTPKFIIITACEGLIAIYEITEMTAEEMASATSNIQSELILDKMKEALPCNIDVGALLCNVVFLLGESVEHVIENGIHHKPLFNSVPEDVSDFYREMCPGIDNWCNKLYKGQIKDSLESFDISTTLAPNPLPLENPTDVPPCPPTLTLAKLDPTFIIDPLCTYDMNCTFNPGVDICYNSATPSKSLGGQHCCYKDEQIYLKMPGAGIPYTIHPSLNGGSNSIARIDINWLLCCSFGQPRCIPRKPDPGQNYTSPNSTFGNGDPHFTTFDGLFYTFNGAGEFWLLKNTTKQPIAAQARFILPDGLSSRYTYLGTFAFKSPNSSIVQVEADNEGIMVYYDSIPIPINILKLTFNIDNVAITSDGQSVTVTFSEGFSFVISEWAIQGFANVAFKGNFTQGIFGTFDGNPFNDLETPYDVIVPANSTTEVIHYKFGMEWYVKPEESLFNYFGNDYSTYYFPHFKPNFGYSDGQLPPNADEICDKDPSCLWDLVTTGDESIANQTRSDRQQFNSTTSTTSQNITMCPMLHDPINGYCSIMNYLPGSSAECKCNSGYELSGDTNLMCMSIGKWNGTRPLCDLILTTTTEAISTTIEAITKPLNPSTEYEIKSTTEKTSVSTSKIISTSKKTTAKVTSTQPTPTPTTSNSCKLSLSSIILTLTSVLLLTFKV